jgi:hypothetical protein
VTDAGWRRRVSKYSDRVADDRLVAPRQVKLYAEDRRRYVLRRKGGHGSERPPASEPLVFADFGQRDEVGTGNRSLQCLFEAAGHFRRLETRPTVQTSHEAWTVTSSEWPRNTVAHRTMPYVHASLGRETMDIRIVRLKVASACRWQSARKRSRL